MNDNLHSEFTGYHVKLAVFEGPLDLLLHLIKKNEMDIWNIQISLITAQYLEYLALLTELNVDVAGEFVLMAATLIHIKSRMLLPRPDPIEENADPLEDPRSDLIRRLMEHERCRTAAGLLRERQMVRDAMWQRPDERVADLAGENQEPELEVDLFSLLSAFRDVIERFNARPVVEVPGEQISMEARIEQLKEHLAAREACGFEELFEGDRTRAALVVTFLALLEMIRLRLVRIYQSGPFGPIRVYATGLRTEESGLRTDAVLSPHRPVLRGD